MPSRRSALAAAALLVLACGPAGAVGLKPAPGDMSLGNPKAPIEVVEYASLSCPHCARFNNDVFPAFKTNYVDTGKVHYVLREFLTPPANVAAAGFLIARCAGPAKYFAVVDGVFKSQTQWVDGADIRAIILKVANDNGLSEAQFEACLKDTAALNALQARVQKAVEVDKVQSTPTFIVNGRVVKEGEISLAELHKAIAEAAQVAPAKPGGR